MFEDYLNVEELICNAFVLAFKELNLRELNNVDLLKYIELIKDYYQMHLGHEVLIDQETVEFLKVPEHYHISGEFNSDYQIPVSDYLKLLLEHTNKEFVVYLQEKYLQKDNITSVNFSYVLKNDKENID